jgi:hypothetical protein
MATPIWPIEGIALDSTGDMVNGSLGDIALDLLANIDTLIQVYPTLANGIDVVSANADWTLGAFTQIVPASTIGSDFHIHGVIIEALNRDAVFELVLYYGAGDTEVARMRWAQAGGFFGNAFLDTITGTQIPADSRIRAKFASSNGAAQIATVRISLRYAVYGG